MQTEQDAGGNHKPHLFYVVDWLPPDFGAVGQYALNASRALAAEGRQIHLLGVTSGVSCRETIRFPASDGVLTIEKLAAKPYEKIRLARRLMWTLVTNIRLIRAVWRNPASKGADIQFTGAPPFMLYFAVLLKYLRGARLIYRITDFYPEAIVAHLGRRPVLLAAIERVTWFLRRKVDFFEVLGEDQRALLIRGGIAPARIILKRDTAPVEITGRETPASKPLVLAAHKVLLYSGNYGVAHEVETVAEGFARHHREGTARFGLWLNASGRNADWLERRLIALDVPVARTPPVALKDFSALLAAADAHLIALRPQFAGIVFPSKVYACILSNRPILFVGPEGSDVHLLCTQAHSAYVRVPPGDPRGFAQALDDLGAMDP